MQKNVSAKNAKHTKNLKKKKTEKKLSHKDDNDPYLHGFVG